MATNLPHSCVMVHRVISEHYPTFRYNMPASRNPFYFVSLYLCPVFLVVGEDPG